MKYCFYYDESEHSRVINLSTVTGETYYDSFIAAIVGWRSDKEKRQVLLFLQQRIAESVGALCG